MGTDRPYARVYYVDLQRDYPVIYRDNDAYSTYVRLLAVAEAMWPSVPEVPRSERSVFVKRLVDASLVKLVPPYGFTIKGMEAERGARSAKASNAASTRWGNAPSIATGSARAMPNRAEPNLTEPSPIRAQGARKNGVDPRAIVDQQKLTADEQQERYLAAQRAAGLPVDS